MKIKQLVIGVLLCLNSIFAHAFGQDICFSAHGMSRLNCLNVGKQCRTNHLSPEMDIQCRLLAIGSALSSFGSKNGGNELIGGRSLVHSDATYFMAQLIGYSPWQAYEIMVYSEATDQSQYTPFGQNGRQLLSNATIVACQNQWGSAMPNECLLTTPSVKGVGRFSVHTGGIWLHLHARYSPDGQPLSDTPYPVDYLAPQYATHEKLLHDFHAWVFDEKKGMCVYGITNIDPTTHTINSCTNSKYTINSTMNMSVFSFPPIIIPFVTPLGNFQINNTDNTSQNPVYANDRSLDTYLFPHEAAYAKIGMFIHSLADRYSHHVCSDRSYFFQNDSGNYEAIFNSTYCAQGGHFLRHVWEQGTDQSDANLDKEFQTIRPALLAVYQTLLAYAQHREIPIHANVDRDKIIDDLVRVLSLYDASERLDQMVALMDAYQILPLPGHGSATHKTIEQWLQAAGAPVISRP